MLETAQPFVIFILYFLQYFFQLVYWSILIWVVLSWVILFGIMKPSNQAFQFMTQLVQPILKPFRWARIGAIDLSPIAAIFVLAYIVGVLEQVLRPLI